MKKSQRRFVTTKNVVAGIFVAAVIVFALVYWTQTRNDSKSNETANNDPGTTSSQINYDPPTQQEIDETERYKQDIPDVSTKPGEDTSNLATVTPIITFADSSEITAIVPGTAEDGGECSVELTHAGTSFTKNSKAFRNVNTTNCEPISLSASDFNESGTWSATLNYSSSSSKGRSEPVTFEVIK